MAQHLNKDYLRQEAENAARDIRTKIDEVHGPYWKSRNEISKLIISLSSAILVGTITFSGSLLTSATGSAQCPSLIIVSWIFLLLSLLLGIASIWFNSVLLSFHPRFINSGPELDQKFEELNPESETLVNDILDVVGEISNKALEPVGAADKRSQFSTIASLVTFGLGICIFIIFGSIHLHIIKQAQLNRFDFKLI